MTQVNETPTERDLAGGSPTGKKPIAGQFWTFARKTKSQSKTVNRDDSNCPDELTASKTFTPKRTMDPSHSARTVDAPTGTYGANRKGSATDSGCVVTGKYNEEQIDEIEGAGPNKDASKTIPNTAAAMATISQRKLMDPGHTGRAATDNTGCEAGSPTGGPYGAKFGTKQTMDTSHSARPRDQDNTEEYQPEIETDEDNEPELIDETEKAEQEQLDAAYQNQLSLAVSSAAVDQPDAFTDAFNKIISKFLAQKIAERKQQIASNFLGSLLPDGSVVEKFDPDKFKKKDDDNDDDDDDDDDSDKGDDKDDDVEVDVKVKNKKKK